MKLKFSLFPNFTALLCAVFLVCGCSGTGTMYTPENDEENAATADTASEETAGNAAHDAENSAGGTGKAGHQSSGTEQEEEPHAKSTYLGGIGSDLYSVKTLDYYYGFTLEGTSMQLPCAASDITGAGWNILVRRKDEKKSGKVLVSPYSYEFFDAAYNGNAGQSDESGQEQDRQDSGDPSDKKIRLCLANPTDSPLAPSACKVCGISASLDSGVSLQTVFGAGTGSTLSDLTSVFGTDDSVYSLTQYSDGTSSLRYCFSNGLAVHEYIPVLAEAEEKSLAECLLAETAPDGQTITRLSLYYFRLEDADEEAKKELAAEEATAAAEEAAEAAAEATRQYYEDNYSYQEPAQNNSESKKSKKDSSKKKSKEVKIKELGPSN